MPSLLLNIFDSDAASRQKEIWVHTTDTIDSIKRRIYKSAADNYFANFNRQRLKDTIRTPFRHPDCITRPLSTWVSECVSSGITVHLGLTLTFNSPVANAPLRRLEGFRRIRWDGFSESHDVLEKITLSTHTLCVRCLGSGYINRRPLLKLESSFITSKRNSLT